MLSRLLILTRTSQAVIAGLIDELMEAYLPRDFAKCKPSSTKVIINLSLVFGVSLK